MMYLPDDDDDDPRSQAYRHNLTIGNVLLLTLVGFLVIKFSVRNSSQASIVVGNYERSLTHMKHVKKFDDSIKSYTFHSHLYIGNPLPRTHLEWKVSSRVIPVFPTMYHDIRGLEFDS